MRECAGVNAAFRKRIQPFRHLLCLSGQGATEIFFLFIRSTFLTERNWLMADETKTRAFT